MRATNHLVVTLLAVVMASTGRADEVRTSLIIEGGGLPHYCPALEKFVELAKVEGRIRIGFLPTAATNPAMSAKRFVARLGNYGVLVEQIQILDLTIANAAEQSENPALVKQIHECTAIFFGGGDQTRITRSLFKPDGTPTAALQAIYSVWKSGGIIAGTSAGAAVQSEKMISVSGFPDDSIDDGMDALDFGLTRSIEQPARRGLLVTRGLGFLRSGIVDQHFSQYRGRLGRLARAAIEERVRFGFGIDEDAALTVATDGTMEILGPGYVTIVDTAGATCQDSVLGCSIRGVQLSCLGQGDRFDPKTGVVSIHPDKKPIEPGKERYNGNFQIPDISGRGAVLHAIFAGLGNNTSRKQVGIAIKYNRHYGHGYRYTFSESDQTQGYQGIVKGYSEATVTQVRLDIEPVALTLRSPETGLPVDLPLGPSRPMLEAICFRGIMLADDQGHFRPKAPINRGDLACAITRVIRLEPTRQGPPAISDVPDSSPDHDEIARVVGVGLMEVSHGSFRPKDSISRQEAATVLVRLAERYRSEVLPAMTVALLDDQAIASPNRRAVFAALQAGLLKVDTEAIHPDAPLTREDAALALSTIIGFSHAK